MIELLNMMPYQKEIILHQKQFPAHTRFTITGNKKKEKLRGAFCKTCKKYITTIRFLSSTKERR